MKEITRIHIAKQAYDIEIAAKKELEKYMKKLEAYAGDPEILQEIEVRITELLTENGVNKNGVITGEVIAKVQEILGDPKEFATDESVEINEIEESPKRRLFRNMDGAVLGGVLNGIATYFKQDVVFVRALFLLLCVISFGTLILIYLAMWLIVPPAVTAAEKLQLAGKPVTLDELRKQAEAAAEVRPPKLAKIIRAVFFLGGGIVSLLAGLGALVAAIGVSLAYFGEGFSEPNPGYSSGLIRDEIGVLAFCLFVMSGLLFSFLMFLVSGALFRRKLSKRLGVTIIVVVIAGLVSFGSGVGATLVGRANIHREVSMAMRDRGGELPAEASKVKKLVVAVDGNVKLGETLLNVVYNASQDAPRYELQLPFAAKPAIKIQGDTLKIDTRIRVADRFWTSSNAPTLVVYGPALDSIDVKQGSVSYSTSTGLAQKSLVISSTSGGVVQTVGSYGSVEVAGNGNIDLESSAIQNLSINLGSESPRVSTGVVGSLEITQPTACSTSALEYGELTVNVPGVSSGSFKLNGETRALGLVENPCGVLSIGVIDSEE